MRSNNMIQIEPHQKHPKPPYVIWHALLSPFNHTPPLNMDSMTNPWLTGSSTQQRCSVCASLLCFGKCLDCLEDEARYHAAADLEPDNCDEFRNPRDHDDEDLFGFAAMVGSAQRLIVPQAIRAGSPWMSTPVVN